MPNSTTPEGRETYTITTTGISLVAAWSWEHCFNLAFDIIGYEYQVGYDGLVPKVILSVVMPLCLLPVYVTYVRKMVMEIEVEQEKRDADGPTSYRTPRDYSQAAGQGRV